MASPAPKTAIIVGGSLAGLMHGIMLRDAGWSVRILERSKTPALESHMAGVCLAADVLVFLDRHDALRDVIEIGIPSVSLQTLRPDGSSFVFQRVPRVMTSWDALYSRLRFNFDGLTTSFVGGHGKNAAELNRDKKPRAQYDVGMNVTDVEAIGAKVLVRADDATTGETKVFEADVVLGADGPSSVVRRTFLPDIERQYCGYVAWRGVVPENQVSEATRRAFAQNITCQSVDGGHVIVYNIPGENGSVKEGERVLNFCWYSNETLASLDNVMTDIAGVRHRTNVPPTTVRPELWKARQQLAKANFLQPYAEIVENISSPFVHLISDYWAPQVSFCDGRVLLVGDASALLRPHIAFSTAQAAFQCLMVEDYLVKGSISSDQLNWQVTNFTATHLARSVWYGKWFQEPLTAAFRSALDAWGLQSMSRLRYWLGISPAPRG